MKFLTISKTVLILTIPFLIFLGAANQIVFDKSYYTSKFSEYGMNIPKANFLNEKTIDFVSGKTDELPETYNEREKQHLNDIRNIVKKSRIILYIFSLLFISLLLASAFLIRMNKNLASFIGNVLAYGSFLAIGLAALLLILINFSFPSAFDSFHTLFFRQGTYTFDPAKEIIVNLYPEQFFMDLGLRISKWALFVSAISIIAGAFLIVKSKTKRINR